MKRAAFRNKFGPPPANTVPSYQACWVGCVGGLGVLTSRCEDFLLTYQVQHPLYAITQARNSSAIVAACSAWVLGNHAGSLDSGDETFSSGAILALPSFRAFFVLRDGRHSKRKTDLISACQKTEVAQRRWSVDRPGARVRAGDDGRAPSCSGSRPLQTGQSRWGLLGRKSSTGF